MGMMARKRDSKTNGNRNGKRKISERNRKGNGEDNGLADGSRKAFFKKGAPGPVGQSMMGGSFESEAARYAFILDHVPKPLAHGAYHAVPDLHFSLADYVDMDNTHPDPALWAGVCAAVCMSRDNRAGGFCKCFAHLMDAV
jgi:hypothetical protein